MMLSSMTAGVKMLTASMGMSKHAKTDTIQVSKITKYSSGNHLQRTGNKHNTLARNNNSF